MTNTRPAYTPNTSKSGKHLFLTALKSVASVLFDADNPFDKAIILVNGILQIHNSYQSPRFRANNILIILPPFLLASKNVTRDTEGTDVPL